MVRIEGNSAEVFGEEQSMSWRESSYSAGSGECVEIGADGIVFAIRDTKQEGQPEATRTTLRLPIAIGRVFLADIKSDSYSKLE